VIAVLGVTLTACGPADEPDGGTTTPSSSPSSDQPASSADPKAGWHTAEEDEGQLLVPPDWDVENAATGINLHAPRTREGGARVGGGIFASRLTIDSSGAIDDAGDTALAFHRNGMDKAERLPDVTLGGLRFYHVRGEDSAQWLDDYGTVKDGKLITVLWTFNRGFVDRKQTDEMINQVMSTFEPTS
jgi:hypothetical protein